MRYFEIQEKYISYSFPSSDGCLGSPAEPSVREICRCTNVQLYLPLCLAQPREQVIQCIKGHPNHERSSRALCSIVSIHKHFILHGVTTWILSLPGIPSEIQHPGSSLSFYFFSSSSSFHPRPYYSPL